MMMRVLKGAPLSTFLLGSLFLLLSACTPDKANQLVLEGYTMGTTYTVKIVPADQPLPKNLDQLVFAELENIDQLMSSYRQDSELSLFNKIPKGQSLQVSADTLAVVALAKKIGEQSNGSLDITIAPLVDLWGFGAAAKASEIPSDKAIAQAKARMGLDKLILDVQRSRLTKTAAIEINLSAIAKGYGVDKVAMALQKLGFKNYMVEVGGEVRCAGINSKGRPWSIGVETPVQRQGIPYMALVINNEALATSGDYRNYYEQDGVRFSHTIDPVTGKPITHNLASVTVIDKTTASADGLATALNVMGPSKGLAWAEQHNIAALFIVKQGDSFTEIPSRAFLPYMPENSPE